MCYFKVSLYVIQSILVGNLSQYFCEKNSLEKELSALRNDNNTDSELINSKEEEIQISTRNAYLYAAGMVIVAFMLAFSHAWTFFICGILGMKSRILLIGAIFEKVKKAFYICIAIVIVMYTYVYICVYMNY